MKICVLVIGLYVAAVDSSCCLKSIDHDAVQHNVSFKCYTYETYIETTLALCAIKCFVDENCRSINFNSVNNLCELNNASVADCIWCLVHSAGSSYYPRHAESNLTDCGYYHEQHLLALSEKVNKQKLPQRRNCGDVVGGIKRNAKCYYLSKIELSWVEATSYCALKTGGNMARITDQDTLNDIADSLHVENGAWFDLSNIRNKQRYSTLKLAKPEDLEGVLDWNDTNEDHVLCGATGKIASGIYNTTMQDCNIAKTFICQFPDESEVKHPICHMNPVSGISYVFARQNSSYIVLGEQQTMYTRDAFYLCLDRGAIPLTIENEGEHRDVVKHLVKGRGFKNVAIGVTKTTVSNEFEWLDGNPYTINLSPMDEEQPQNFAILKTDGRFYQSGTYEEDVGVVCKV